MGETAPDAGVCIEVKAADAKNVVSEVPMVEGGNVEVAVVTDEVARVNASVGVISGGTGDGLLASVTTTEV